MSTFRFLLWGFVALCLIVLALANRQMVELRLFPDALEQLFNFNYSFSVPLFVAIFVGVGLGLLLGLIGEWIRESRIRREAKKAKKEAAQLRKEVAKTDEKKKENGQDVIALVEAAPAK